MSYKLHYFPFRGRGEQVRLLLHALEVPFEDVKVSRQGFMTMKQQGPQTLAFGSLPMLEGDGDFRLAQGPAILSYIGRCNEGAPANAEDQARAEAFTLAAEDCRVQYFQAYKDEAYRSEWVEGNWKHRWLPAFEAALATGDGLHVVGERLSFADVALWDVLDAVTTNIDAASLDGFPALEAFYKAFAARPAVATYLAARPD